MHESFARAIAHTSLIGGTIMAAGTLIVVAVLPGRKHTTEHGEAAAPPATEEQTETVGA